MCCCVHATAFVSPPDHGLHVRSLLETVLEYDQAQPAAPEVTAESTAALEDVIKQRIRDEIWDDVERKVAEPLKRAIELPDVSMEQSKLGLGEIYEKEYMKQAMNVAEPDEKQLLRVRVGGVPCCSARCPCVLLRADLNDPLHMLRCRTRSRGYSRSCVAVWTPCRTSTSHPSRLCPS